MKTIPRSFFLFITLAIASAVFAYPAHAGRYELIKGKGVEVCEAYKRNFELFDNARPMACERQYNPSVKGFSSPPWQKLDLKKYIDLYRKAEIYRETGYLSEKDLKADTEHIEGRAEALKVELYLARLDINGDGKLDNIFAIRDAWCGPHPSTEKEKTTRVLILNDSLTDIDYARQEEWSGFYRNSTIMLYKGKPYIEGYWPDDGWGNLFTKSGQFYVQQVFPLARVCQFEYVPSAENSSKELSNDH